MIKNTLLLCLHIGAFMVFAQDESQYSEEELFKYASVMSWAEEEKLEMTTLYNSWIKNDRNLNAPRFLEIKKAYADSIKLKEIEVAPVERRSFEKIQARYDSITSSFMESYKNKIMTDIGAGLYNSLRMDLKKDQELERRYQKIVLGLSKKTEAGQN